MPSRELCTGATGELGAESVANVSRPSLNVALARRAGVLNCQLDAERLAEIAAELFVIAGLVTKSVVDVQRAHIGSATDFNCEVEQANRIAPTREADNDALASFEQSAVADPLEQLFS
jgi:hypothetical protein